MARLRLRFSEKGDEGRINSAFDLDVQFQGPLSTLSSLV